MSDLIRETLISIGSGIAVALLFGLAIFIHELGHYLAARMLGLQIDAFAIGFGPALWKRRINGVEYKLGAIPFGGYVALPQLDPSGMERLQGDDHADGEEQRVLPSIAAWKRIIVALSGPIGNVILAIVLAYIIFWAPAANTGVVGTRIGAIAQKSEAYKAGLRVGDKIMAVNGQRVQTWSDFEVECQLKGESGVIAMEVERDGSSVELEVPLRTMEVLEIKMLDGVAPEGACVISGVNPDSVAERAGLKERDIVKQVDGVAILSTVHFLEMMQERGAQEVELEVLRGKESYTMRVTPQFNAEVGRPLIGVAVATAMDGAKGWMMYSNPWQQLKWDSLSVVRVLQALFIPKEAGERKAVAKNVGGPVAIVMGLYRTVQGSFMDGLGFLRMICVNLAILNLLPLPVLDGGHIVFALYEIITRRKPHPKVVAVLVNACAVLLLGLMALLVYRDVVRQVKISRKQRALEQEEQVAQELPQGAGHSNDGGVDSIDVVTP